MSDPGERGLLWPYALSRGVQSWSSHGGSPLPYEAHYPANGSCEGLMDLASCWAMCSGQGRVLASLCSPVSWNADRQVSESLTQ